MKKNGTDIIKPEKLWTRSYVFLMIANFFLFFAGCLLLPVLPVYLKQSNVSDFQIGVVAAVFYITSMFMRFFTSRISMRIGKQMLLMVSMFVFTLAMVGYYLFAGLGFIMILRMIQGLGYGASTTLYASTVANTIPDKKMGEGMGFFGLGISVAFAIGPSVGAAAVALPNFKWVFLLAGLLTLISISLTYFIKKEERVLDVPEEKKFLKSVSSPSRFSLSAFIETKVIYESVFILFLGLLMSANDTYVVLYARQMNIKNIALYFIITTLAEMATRIFSGKLYDKKGMNSLIIPGALIGIIGCILAANASNLLLLCIFAVFYGGAIGMIFPVLEANTMKKVSPERRIIANATFNNFLDIGSCLGPLLFGLTSQLAGYSHTFLASGLVFVIMLLIILFRSIFFQKTEL